MVRSLFRLHLVALTHSLPSCSRRLQILRAATKDQSLSLNLVGLLAKVALYDRAFACVCMHYIAYAANKGSYLLSAVIETAEVMPSEGLCSFVSQLMFGCRLRQHPDKLCTKRLDYVSDLFVDAVVAWYIARLEVWYIIKDRPR